MSLYQHLFCWNDYIIAYRLFSRKRLRRKKRNVNVITENTGVGMFDTENTKFMAGMRLRADTIASSIESLDQVINRENGHKQWIGALCLVISSYIQQCFDNEREIVDITIHLIESNYEDFNLKLQEEKKDGHKDVSV